MVEKREEIPTSEQQFISALRNFHLKVGEEEFEVRRRAYLAPKVFIAFFQEDIEKKKEAIEAYLELSNTAKRKIIAYTELVADYLENKGTLPKFLEEHLAEFLIAMKYLVYGNGDIERGFNNSVYEEAKQYALETSSKTLDVNFFVRRRKDYL